ncbi:hypothetical protein DFQ27_002421 [Actinomortierella ambigua]|uniref:VWFA domain-containing protein n=1 Tax=Actinomortierella ambigua TaxID=1343610 RepID=A0A9P6QAG1_9FUNG|nr:hypothetical protein DFQ26_002526 [Actinomortierella ambigua]KAG0262349.1 hypothetical protein DFQ27_002421 [Actinomortierella ambigua]
MVLEATILVGDYTPTRLEAQTDAVNLLFQAKTQSNPENTVSLMTMAGKSPEVLVTFTSDVGKILTALHNVKIGGEVSFSTGVQVAHLALKHRQNKNQRQRIIVFAGSPVEEDEKSLVRLAKKLKKNNVAVDIVNFGEEAENTTKLEAFIAAVNNNENSNLVTVPPGPHLLGDILASSAILAGEDGQVPAFVSSGGGNFEFGVDPNLDPELALALRISLEEERARQEAANAKAKAEAGPSAAGAGGAEGSSSSAATMEDDMLAQALNSSKAEMDQDMPEDEATRRAIEMSMQSFDGGAGGDDDAPMYDADIMNSVLDSLSGVDKSDPRIQSALDKSKKEGDGDDKKKEDK